MTCFFYPLYREVPKEQFVSRYSDAYFLSGKAFYGACQTSRFVEKEIERILSRGFRNEIDVSRVLAWKLGKINQSESEKAQRFRYAKDWGEAESLKVSRYGKPFDLARVASYVSENAGQLEAVSAQHPQDVLIKLRDLDVKGLGTTYLVTLLYFLSHGEWPIYDRFAATALRAIENGAQPGDVVHIDSLPEKTSKGFSAIVDERLLPYRDRLESLFGKGCSKDRNVDRALWVYGHAFAAQTR